MRSSNPMFGKNMTQRAVAGENAMTASGAAGKANILMLIVFATAFLSWSQAAASGSASSLMILGGIGGFILAIATAIKPNWAPVTAPVYAALEGLFLGGISYTFEVMYPGIAVQAVLGTLCVTLIMLFLYQTRIIKVTERFRSVVTGAIMAIAAVYLLSFVVSIFAPQYSIFAMGGTMGLVISVFVIIVAALALMLDFDLMEKSEAAGMPKFMEWYCAFALLVTLVWLYVEMLRLMSILRGND